MAGKKLMKNVDLDEPTSFRDRVYLGCTQRECKPNETIIQQFKKIITPRKRSLKQWENYPMYAHNFLICFVPGTNW